MLKDHPDVVRVLTGAFDLHLLPNRVEMRLKPSNKVIGYTVTFVRDDSGNVIGAAMFFKDLTRVEQLEERERLRDRLAAVGEMAAVIAHEVKNPLAGIEVMAGLLRRKIADAPDAQAVLTDIIKEAKMANAIVQEVLDFVRPDSAAGRAHRRSPTPCRARFSWRTRRRGAARCRCRWPIPDGLPQIQADQHQLTQVFTNLLMNAYEAMGGSGHVSITASRCDSRMAPIRARRFSCRSPTMARAFRPTWRRRCSTRSSRRSRRAQGWGWPSSGRLWMRTTDG